MKKALFLAACSLVFVACQESFDKKLEKDAATYTAKNCPQKMDDYGTVLDSLSYDAATQTYGYYYHLPEMSNNNMMTEKLKEDYRKTLLESIKNSIEIKQLKEKGINLRYLYRYNQSDTVALDLVFTKDDYNN